MHGAHGYLPSDFLSPVANQRDDEYGGTLEKRFRFAREVARAIQDATEHPAVLAPERRGARRGRLLRSRTRCRWRSGSRRRASRASPSPPAHGSACRSRSRRCTSRAATCSRTRQRIKRGGRHPGDRGRSARRPRAGGARRRRRIDRHRAPRSRPARRSRLAAQARAGRRGEIRPCIACNACVDRVALGLDIRCAVNAELGRESTWHGRALPAPRRRDGRRQRSRRAWRRRGRARPRPPGVRSGSATTCSAASSTSPRARRASGEVLRFRDYQTRDARAARRRDPHGRRGDAGARRARRIPTSSSSRPAPTRSFRRSPGSTAQRRRRAGAALPAGRPRARRTRVVIVGGSATGCETAELLVEDGLRRDDRRDAAVDRQGNRGDHAAPPRAQAEKRRRRDPDELQGDDDRARARAVRGRGRRGARARPPTSSPSPSAGAHAASSSRLPLAGREVVVLGDASRPADFVAAVGAGADAGAEI